jgi:hypothetical protein
LRVFIQYFIIGNDKKVINAGGAQRKLHHKLEHLAHQKSISQSGKTRSLSLTLCHTNQPTNTKEHKSI